MKDYKPEFRFVSFRWDISAKEVLCLLLAKSPAGRQRGKGSRPSLGPLISVRTNFVDKPDTEPSNKI